MKVKDLIKALQKLPQESIVLADVLGDSDYAEIVGAKTGFGKGNGFVFIGVDRSEELKNQLNYISVRNDYE